MHNRHWGSERRRLQRLKVNLTVAYEVYSPLHVRDMVGDKEVEAITLDLCAGGMSILTKYNIPVWSALLIKFLFFKTDNEGSVTYSEPVDIMGEVRSAIQFPHNEYRLGIAFKGIERNSENRIADFAESTKSP